VTALRKVVRRVIANPRRNLVVTLHPGEMAEIEVREARRRVGYRVTVATLYTMLAARAANLPAPRGRKARRIS